MALEFESDGKFWVLTAEHVSDNADNRDATPADLIAALNADPELRQRVLEQMPEHIAMDKRAEAAEAALSALRLELQHTTDAWDRLSGEMSTSLRDHVAAKGEAYANVVKVLRATLKQPPQQAQAEDSSERGTRVAVESAENPSSISSGVAPSRGESGHPSGSGATEPPPSEGLPMWRSGDCVAHLIAGCTCGPCLKSRGFEPPPAEPASGGAERVSTTEKDLRRSPGGDTRNTDPSPTERHSGELGTVPGHPSGFVERVGHYEAREYARQNVDHDSPAWRMLLLRYIDQQEQAEREAAELRERVEGYRTAWAEACGEREQAKDKLAESEKANAELRAELVRAGNLYKDTVDACDRLLTNNRDSWQRAAERAEAAETERDALKAENAELRKAVSDLTAVQLAYERIVDDFSEWAGKHNNPAYVRMHQLMRTVKVDGEQSPTSASPAKFGHWSDCSDCTEQGGYCPKHPAKLGVAQPLGCSKSGACIHPDGHWYPCSSEPDRPVMVGELVEALNGVAECDVLSSDVRNALRWAADRLERGGKADG